MNATQQKFKPILFSTEMVQAILAGRKTQTRRVCSKLMKLDKIAMDRSREVTHARNTAMQAFIDSNRKKREHITVLDFMKAKNHEIWKTCRNCGHEFDARVELQLRCPKCNSTNIK